jgi:hypothetical protein
MGIGHLAVGFAAKRWAPHVSLGWLLAAPVLVDMLWGLFIFLGIERARIVPGFTEAMPLDLHDMAISHSLVGTLGWALVFAAAYVLRHRDLRAGVILAIGVLSHFVLDWIAHTPDMQLMPGGARYGLGLWNHAIAAMLGGGGPK